VDTGMAYTMSWFMVIKEILRNMNGENSKGKVHYLKIEASTVFWGIMVLRVFR
jgi:hypothetical protein